MKDLIKENHSRIIAQRVRNIEPSKTLAVDAKAKELISKGKDIIAFGAGEPDFSTFDPIVKRAVEAAYEPDSYKYSSTQGLLSLRELIADATNVRTGFDYSPDNVIVTNGSKQALANVCLSILDPLDEVIIISPFWTTYPELVKLSDAIAKVVATTHTDGFHLDLDALSNAITEKTKAIIINSPSNPTGVQYDVSEILALGELVQRHNIYLISDDIYAELIFNPEKQYVPAKFLKDIKDRIIIVDGASKTYAMTGWRLGWVVANTEIIKACVNLQSHMTSNVANIVQKAGEAALKMDKERISEVRELYRNRKDLIVQLAQEIDAIELVEPDGAFYIFPSFKHYLGRSYRNIKIKDTQHLAELALEFAGVAFVPGEAFGAPGYGRFSFATSEDLIEEGFGRLKKFFKEVN